jgi:Tol biopolymer transport system component
MKRRVPVKNLFRFAAVTMAAVVSAGLLMGQAQQTDAERTRADRARQNAQTFQLNATVITFYDREGKMVGTVGERALYGQPMLSPDRTQVAVIKNDLDAESSDLWVLDVATGKGTRITTSAKTEFVRGQVWSPDGKHLAYVALRSGSEGIYRKAANGEGAEELIYKNPGFGLNLSDWSLDGRFVSFAKSDLSGGTLYVLPLSGQERQPVEVFHSELQVGLPRFSPDGRYLSYVQATPAQRGEIFIRPADPSIKAGPWKVAELGGGAITWRRDGKELYYVGVDRSVMVADVSTTPSFDLKNPRVLFRPPGAVPVGINGISNDGERFIALPPPRGPQLQQITIYDREGKVVRKVGEPGLLQQPAFSPDGTKLALLRNDPNTSRTDIWTFDIASGKGTPLGLGNDVPLNSGPMWSPDGRHILYVSIRGSYSGIYRRSSDGSGSEELLFRYTPGAGIQLTDVSPDGKFLTFSSGGVVLVVPLTGTDPLARKAIEFSREEFDVALGRFSPDGRFVAYRSNEANGDRFQVYVRPFNAALGTAGDGKWQASKNPVAAMVHWRADGKEMFFRDFNEPGTTDLRVMSVDITTAPTFQPGTPKVLFSIPGPINGNLGNISRDGQRFVFAINVPAQ